MQKPKKQMILIAAGLLIVSISQMTWHFMELPDFVNGVLIGLGIGLMFIALFNKRKQPKTPVN
ncbi:MAG: hypothetical protein WBL27_04410 [Salinimicrobium sp.]